MLGFVDASDTQMTSLVAAARNQVSPVKFEGVYTRDDRVREIDVGYDAAGMIDSYRLVKRGDVRVSAVPPGLNTDALDPLAAMLRVRGMARSGAGRVRSGAQGLRRPQALRHDGALSRPDAAHR